MKKSSFEQTFERFMSWINWYTDLLVKVTTAKRVTGNPEVKMEILEAFVLKVYVTWELLAEELIVDCLNRDTSQYAKFKGISLPRNLNRATCACLITGLGFFDVRSTSEVCRIAMKILVPEYNPFRVLKERAQESRTDRRRIDEFLVMRNYLAHYSDLAKRSLIRMYEENYGLERFREPGDFLLAVDGKTRKVRFANYLDSFRNVGVKMAKSLGV